MLRLGSGMLLGTFWKYFCEAGFTRQLALFNEHVQ